MAEFCTGCAERYGMIPDIDIEGLLTKLRPGEKIRFLCESCETVALMKDMAGDTFRGYYRVSKIEWVKIVSDLV